MRIFADDSSLTATGSNLDDLLERINSELPTILDKPCWHMLKKGTFPPKFLNNPAYYEVVSVATPPPPPNNVATNVFHIQRKNLDDSELNTWLT